MNTIPSLRALILVDVQPTFCEDGDLPVDGGNAVADSISTFLYANHDQYGVILSTQDWHVDPGHHFSDEPDFVDTWPAHGVAGTTNAELHPVLPKQFITAQLKKGEYAACYSGFEAVDSDNKPLESYLEGVTKIDIVGIALSHCVKETALDARRLGYKTRVFLDLTVPVTPELGEEAKKILEDAGVELVETTPYSW